jgi:hypothetical protein
LMKPVKQDEFTLAEGCEVLCLSYRQTKPVWRRHRLEGDQGFSECIKVPTTPYHSPHETLDV